MGRCAPGGFLGDDEGKNAVFLCLEKQISSIRAKIQSMGEIFSFPKGFSKM
jgi:hypothetical protein